MSDVLYTLCRHCTGIWYCWYPYPSTLLSKVCNKSLYQTRKELKILKEQGYIKSDKYCAVTEDGNYLINGYTITEKAKETEEYRKAYAEAKRLFNWCFNINTGEEDK